MNKKFVFFIAVLVSVGIVFSFTAQADDTNVNTGANTNTSTEVVKNVTELYIGKDDAAIQWEPAVVSVGLVEYGTSSGSYTKSTITCGQGIQQGPSLPTPWLKLDNLTPGTKYYYRVKLLDDVGSNKVLGYSEEKSFTTKSEIKIDYIAPTSGSLGSTLTIIGQGFGNYPPGEGQSSVVNVGNKNISICGGKGNASVISWNDTVIKAKLDGDDFCVPKTGKVNLYRTLQDGICYVMPAGIPIMDVDGPTFTVTDPVTITSISPKQGAVGTKVTITGKNFGDNCGGGHGCNLWVYFGNGYVTNHDFGIDSWTDTSIQAIVPSNASTGAIRIAKYSDSNDVDPGGDIVQYDVTGPVFTVTKSDSENTNQNTNTAVVNTNTSANLNTDTSSTSKIASKYGCSFSTTVSNSSTIKVKTLFTKDSTTDAYLGSVYQAYYDAWKRYPRCDEMQFQLDHSTPLATLQTWLKSVASVTQTGDDYLKSADMKVTENEGKVTFEDATKTLTFKDTQHITLSGIAEPNSTISLTIASQERTYTTTTNNEGFWTYTLADTLAVGNHTAKVAVYDAQGAKIGESASMNFSIISAAHAVTTAPVVADTSGISTLTWIGIAVAAVLIVVIFFIVVRRKKPVQPEKK